MLRKLMVLAVTLVPLAFLPSPFASAASPGLTCNIQPSGNDNLNPSCHTSRAASFYTVDYFMQGVTDPATYAWTAPFGGTVIPGTCTSTSAVCELTVRGIAQDQSLTATVAVTTDGTTTSYSSTATLLAVCGTPPKFC